MLLRSRENESTKFIGKLDGLRMYNIKQAPQSWNNNFMLSLYTELANCVCVCVNKWTCGRNIP